MKNKKIYMILGGIIILGTIFYFYNKNKNKKIDASTDKADDKTDDKPVDKPVDKPYSPTKPVDKSDIKPNVVTNGTIKPTTNVRPKGCPSKEEMARTKYTKEGMDKLKALGC